MARRNSRQRGSRDRTDLYAEVTDRIVAALRCGVAPWVRPWEAGHGPHGGRPRNGASGHVYRGINVLLTAMSGFSSSCWYTFKQAHALGGHVRKGETGTKVVYWHFIDPKRDRSQESDTPSRKIPLLRSYTVFNAEQVRWPNGSKHSPVAVVIEVVDVADHPVARDLVERAGADIRHGGDRAFYTPQADYIRVPDPRRFRASSDYYATVLHELAHWSGHGNRLALDLTGRFGSESYAAEELIAEMTAAFLCADLGVPGRLQHAEYIGSWLRVLEGDNRAVFTAARMAQEAADYLIGCFTRHAPEDGSQEAVEPPAVTA